jgi:hypothetical protein
MDVFAVLCLRLLRKTFILPVAFRFSDSDAEIEKRQHTVDNTNAFELADHALSLYAHCTKNPCPHHTGRG